MLDALLGRLDIELDDEVRVALAINSLAAAGELSLSWRRWRRVEHSVRDALRTVKLDDPEEQRAIDQLHDAYRHGTDRGGAHEALLRLARFWEE